MRRYLGVTVYFFWSAFHAQSANGATCEELTSQQLPKTKIESAQIVAAGAFKLPSLLIQQDWAGSAQVPSEKLPAFCQVLMTISPTEDSAIKVELRLPMQNWNGRFVAVGNGGPAGQINWRAMSGPTMRGYAVASTDTGHAGTSGGGYSWALGHPERVVDNSYRGVHEMVVKSKRLVEAFYGRAPQYSYWNGTSTGGRQGLIEVQRYPEDFDGAVISAAASNPTHLILKLSVASAMESQGSSATPLAEKKRMILNAAVLKSCDAADGVVDGVLERPDRCRFDPESIKCNPTSAPETCLSESELAMAEIMYAPLRNPRTNAIISPGYALGSEIQWNTNPDSDSSAMLAQIYLQKAAWPNKFDLSADVAILDQADANGPQFYAIDPNLSAFFKRGGKLLQVHGWADPVVSPLNSIDYYQSVQKKLGPNRALYNSYRLFMIPGMYHSRGGVGVNNFDSLKVIEQWREQGKAPDQIEGRRIVDGKTVRTHPLCPWPQYAAYKGSGSVDEVASFTCKAPQ